MVIGVYIFYNIVYALSSFPAGILADKAGLKKIYIFGLFLFAIVYFGMSAEIKPFTFFTLFFLYGIYASATEGISKAWITNVVSRKDTATAIGTYSAFQSICSLFASTLAGLIWFKFGAAFTFVITAIATIFILIYFVMLVPRPEKEISKIPA
jgi:MFS family permease